MTKWRLEKEAMLRQTDEDGADEMSREIDSKCIP